MTTRDWYFDVEPLPGGRWRAYEARAVRRGDDGWDEQRSAWTGPARNTEEEARNDMPKP